MSTLHTQASNFLDCYKTGVDNRTGQFTLAIALPLPPANQLCGPSLSLTLSFDMLASTANRGYGLGWNLGLSELDLNQQAPSLRLGSGERFAIDLDASALSNNGQLAFFDLKLNTLRVTTQADGSFRVQRKSGESEILRQQDSDSSRYLLSELHSPEGRRLFVDWLPHAEGDYVLHRIRDEQRTLLTLDERQGDLHFTLNPHTERAATLRAQLSNDWLTHLYLPGMEQPFTIEYEPVDLIGDTQSLLPSHIRSPLGAMDFIHWAIGSEGHRTPAGSPLPFLPRVVAWTHTAGSRDNELNRSYEWIGDHNFLGFGSDQAFEWHSGRDNLYQVQSDYHYEVIETLTDGHGRTLGMLHFTWNRYHLLVSERSRLGHCETRKVTTYGEDPSLAWGQQPASCQLPHEVSITYVDHAQGGASRSEVTTYRYDDWGNMLLARHPSGVEEISEYYPTTGAEGCPADALGMVRLLSKKTVKPAPAEGQAPTLGTFYTYQALPSLIEGAPAHIVVASEQGLSDTAQHVLEHTEQSYCRVPGPHYGRLQSTATTLNGKTTTTEYRYSIAQDDLVTQTTVIGFENDAENRSTSSDGQSLLSGLITWQRSETGALERYAYDALGRILLTTTASASPYQVQQQVRYHLGDDLARQARPDAALNPVMIEKTEASGRRRRQWLDGDGQAVCEELEDIDKAPGTFRILARMQYDALGRRVGQTTFDWFDGDRPALSLTNTQVYDDWGQPALTISPEGIEHHVRHDPVTQRTERWQAVASLKGPKQVLQVNATGSPIQQQDFDSDGHLVRTLTLVRDGLDRVIEERLGVQGKPDDVTRSRYDHYSRLIERTLADGTRLAWTYAAHSDDQHIQTIAITPAHSQAST